MIDYGKISRQVRTIVRDELENKKVAKTHEIHALVMGDFEIDKDDLLHVALTHYVQWVFSVERQLKTYVIEVEDDEEPTENGIPRSTKLETRRKMQWHNPIYVPSLGGSPQIRKCTIENLREAVDYLWKHVEGYQTNIGKYEALIKELKDTGKKTVGQLDLSFVERTLE